MDADVDAADREDGVVRTSAASAATADGSGASAARVGAASAAVSSSGSGRQARPASSRTPTRSTSSRPNPPSASGTTSAGAPSSARTAQRLADCSARPQLVRQLEGTQLVDVALGVEHGAHALAQLVLLLGESEVHRRPDQRGRPSKRSPTTLRWISLVPA